MVWLTCIETTVQERPNDIKTLKKKRNSGIVSQSIIYIMDDNL